MSDASANQAPAYGKRDIQSYEPAAHVSTRRHELVGGTIVAIDKDSPAEREGLEPGMVITYVNDVELTDIIVWDWEADDTDVYLEGVANLGQPDEFEFECDLHRELGQDWGITFDGAVFDGMRLCRNNCEFCFMKMLPRGMRTTLYLRDDDYRLSFLQGNFVTLTNMSDEDVDRVITCALSPLNVSLHAVSPDVRRRLIGRNAARGMEVLEQLLDAGIEIHAQIVLVPHANDGEELVKTLDYVYERPLITSLGIVPLGFTKYQNTYSSSYSDDPQLSAQVVNIVDTYQKRSRAQTGRTRFQLADEFYLFSQIDPPDAQAYDGYPQYYDGIGMVRSFLDDLDVLVKSDRINEIKLCVEQLNKARMRVLYVVGLASRRLAARAIAALAINEVAREAPINNDYFGGNVDVTGLLTATDMLNQLPQDLSRTAVVIPSIVFNADGLTLDGMTREDLVCTIGARSGICIVGEATPAGMVSSLLTLATQM